MKIFIGYDSRFPAPAEVAAYSLRKHSSIKLDISFLILADLVKEKGFDPEPDPKATTEFTRSRFLVPWLCGYEGKALFMDNDMVCLSDVKELADLPLEGCSLRCVKHEYNPTETVKMYGCPQTVYPRKNWSSVMLMDCSKLRCWTKEVVEKSPCSRLHRFQDLLDAQIGSLDPVWNQLDFLTNSSRGILHYTSGGPWYPAYENCLHADLWRHYQEEWRFVEGAKK